MNNKRNPITYIVALTRHIIHQRRTNILHYNGLHLIVGGTGSGKTLLSSIILNKIIPDNDSDHFFWSNIDQYDKNKTKILNLNDVFYDGEQQKRLYNRGCKGMILDEINLNFNRRNNGKKSYNDVFMGLIELSITHRHQGIPRIYYIGQAEDMQDIQLQHIFRYKHIVKKQSKWSYHYYKVDNVIKSIPKKIIVMSYGKGDDGAWVFISKQKIKISVDDLEKYNTYGFANRLLDKPIYNYSHKNK